LMSAARAAICNQPSTIRNRGRSRNCEGIPGLPSANVEIQDLTPAPGTLDKAALGSKTGGE
jgi:hypothetical protein